MRYIIILAFALVMCKVHGQRTDSSLAIGGITRDTIHIIHENIPKSKFLGNSWYLAPSYNLCKTNEFNLDVGRTYGRSFCGGAGCYFTIRSWGLGYGITTKHGVTSNLIRAFWEYTLFYFPPAGVRADYIYDLNNRSHYLRPSVGISLFRVDIFYNYTFALSGKNNLYRHGVTFRIKYFHKEKNWQKSYPSRC